MSAQFMMKGIKPELGLYELLLRPHVYQDLINYKVFAVTGADCHVYLAFG